MTPRVRSMIYPQHHRTAKRIVRVVAIGVGLFAAGTLASFFVDMTWGLQ